VTVSDLELCAEFSFGITDPSALEVKRKMIPNYTAGDNWFSLVFGLREISSTQAGVHGISYKIASGSGFAVCEAIMARVYHVPQATWDQICHAVLHNEVHWRDRGEKQARKHAQDQETKLSVIEHWFLDRYEMFDSTTVNSGYLLHDACVWEDVVKKEFLPEQINCLGNGHLFGNTLEEALDKQKLTALHPSWQAAKKRALMTFALMQNPNATQPFRLVARSQHKGVPDCGTCADIREERRLIQRRHGTKADLEANTLRATKHAQMYMGERRALTALKLSAYREGAPAPPHPPPRPPPCTPPP
jgi:hypothetical protein